MEHLLYSSGEMFSSTHLVRKSKDIFDKLVNDEISKAIILRDGKPNFMLLDFAKYESIMKEYSKLQEFYDNYTNITTINKVNLSENSKSTEKQDSIKLRDNNINDNEKQKSNGEIKEFWN
jgi:hypothetical protein